MERNLMKCSSKDFPLRIALLCVAIFLFLTTEVRANTVTYKLDFESFTDSTPLITQYSSLGITFSEATVITAGVSLNEFDFPPHSGSNVVFDDGSPITLSFSSPTSFVGAYFTYLQPLTIDAFSPGGQLLASETSSFSANDVSSGNPPNEFLSVSAAGIADVTITAGPTGSSLTTDDLTFTEQVPEPATLPLLAIGIIFLIATWRRPSIKLYRPHF
jgi:PEP-CTERM motif